MVFGAEGLGCGVCPWDPWESGRAILESRMVRLVVSATRMSRKITFNHNFECKRNSSMDRQKIKNKIHGAYPIKNTIN